MFQFTNNFLLKKHKYWLSLSLLVTIIFGGFYSIYSISNPSLKIAYIGAYKVEDFEQFHIEILTNYAKDLSQKFPKFDVEIVPFSIDDNIEKSKQIYQQIESDKSFIAVIDNTWGAHLQPTANFIRNSSIPVISLNADKGSVDFGDNAIFIGHDDDVSEDISIFLSDIIQEPRIILFAEHDYAATSKFKHAIQKKHLNIVGEVYVNGKGINLKNKTENDKQAEINDAFDKLWEELEKLQPNQSEEKEKHPIVIVASVHSVWGNELIKRIEQTEYRDIHILSGPYLIGSSDEFLYENMTSNPVIIITRPEDTMSKGLDQTYHEIIKMKQKVKYSAWNLPLFMSRCNRSMSILSKSLNYSNQQRELESRTNSEEKDNTIRQHILQYFRTLKNSTITAFDGDNFYLDDNLRVRRDSAFEKIVNGKRRSYPSQLNEHRKVIPTVYAGLEFLGISNINLSEGLFYADFLITILSKEEVKLKKIMSFSNVKGKVNTETIVSQKKSGTIGGTALYASVHKISGNFRISPSLRAFPFDKQELVISLGLIDSSDKYHLSFLEEDILLSNSNFVNTAGWKISAPYITIDEHISKPLGLINLVSDRNNYNYKSVSLWMEIERASFAAILTILIPPLVIGLSALLVLGIKDLSFENIGEACIALFLSIVTYSVSYREFVPKSIEFTKSDIIFYSTFLLVILILMYVIIINSHRMERFFNATSTKIFTFSLGACYFSLSVYAIWFY